MRILSITFAFLTALLLSACDFWPRDLKPLAESISQQVSGETTIWLVAGDVVVINVAGSPLYRSTRPELEAVAADMAEQAIAFTASPLESIAITFHEGELSDDPEKMQEFIFLVTENGPVLQPDFDTSATGPLTPDEVQAAVDRLGESLTEEQKNCILAETKRRARAAGNPETLDPASVEFLSAVSAETWNAMDAFGKRIILSQAITSKAVFVCAK